MPRPEGKYYIHIEVNDVYLDDKVFRTTKNVKSNMYDYALETSNLLYLIDGLSFELRLVDEYGRIFCEFTYEKGNENFKISRNERLYK
jgi:hypothetical protein